MEFHNHQKKRLFLKTWQSYLWVFCYLTSSPLFLHWLAASSKFLSNRRLFGELFRTENSKPYITWNGLGIGWNHAFLHLEKKSGKLERGCEEQEFELFPQMNIQCTCAYIVSRIGSALGGQDYKLIRLLFHLVVSTTKWLLKSVM